MLTMTPWMMRCLDLVLWLTVALGVAISAYLLGAGVLRALIYQTAWLWNL